MSAADHDDALDTSDLRIACAASSRGRATHGPRRWTAAWVFVGLLTLPLTGCGDLDDAEREAIEALATIPHVRILEVQTGSILPVFSTVDYSIELRLEAGADLRTACETVRSTMSDLTVGRNRTLQSLNVHQQVDGVETV